MFIWDYTNNIITWVNNTWIYTWYVWDEAWNTWICIWEVTSSVFDAESMEDYYSVVEAMWNECTTITWRINVTIWDSCGKDSLDKFRYNWSWLWTSSELWLSSWWVWSWKINVIITDWAWNNTTTWILFTWNDSVVTLDSWVNQNIWIITWEYSITTWRLIELFWAKEWSCGIKNITVKWVNCSWASMTILGWNATITLDSDLNGVEWYCEIVFRDDDGNEETWRIEFTGDNSKPEVTLTWTNLACMNTGNFVVTWQFTESVNWFTYRLKRGK